jgi:serine/threonine-protein kinase HipA
MDCNFQIFQKNTYRGCAILSATQDGRRPLNFQYDLDYVFEQDTAPVSLRYPINAEASFINTWPAFFYDLVPQGAGRAFLLEELGLPDDATSDFLLARAGAFNPIGNLRIAEAAEFFQAHLTKHPALSGNNEGLTLNDILDKSFDFKERMVIFGMLTSGTTGVQGAAPKYLITQDHDDLWFGDSVLPDTRAAKHFILKFPRGKDAADRKVLKNEAAYMRTAAAMGIRTYDQIEHHNDMLFIPRFDRAVVNGKVRRYHQESIASLTGTIGFGGKPSLFTVVQGIRNVVDSPMEETIEFLKRDVLNLAMRNTDNHARNTAIQVVEGKVALTPLFDFAPMHIDPEVIARTLRWKRLADGVELTVWGDVVDELDLPAREGKLVRQAMHSFGLELEHLSDRMKDAGVDDDIIEGLQMPIETQVRQLKDLV